MTTACAGLKILDFSQGMAGALATLILVDNGADVTKVEPPDGDWSRDEPGFLMWNRGKQSAVLDFNSEEDREVARRLAHHVDVVVESFRPGVAERLGIGYSDLAAANPRLIYCSISGFGPNSPDRDLQGYEAVVAARVGRMNGLGRISGAVPGQDRAAPIYTATPVLSFGAAQLAVQAIMAALLARAETGRGQKIETSLLQAATAVMMQRSGKLARGENGQQPMLTPPTIRAGVELCFLTVECADGKWIQMCARQDHHFRNWLTALGLAEALDEPPYRKAPLGIPTLEDIAAIEVRIREKMRLKTRAEWMRIFVEEYDIGGDPFLTPEEFLEHPQLVLNDRVVEIDDPTVGETRQIGPLVLFSDTPSQIGRPAPRLGEHTADVRARAAQANGKVAQSATTSNGSMPSRRHPLSGVTVLEVAYFLAGPFGATILAELGARVIKVEPLEGDPYRRTGLGFVKMVHGKESIALDLKTEAGVKILHELARRSDCLLHSFRPGVPERLKMDYATLSEINPRLVYLYAGSYGSKGPQSHRAAFHSTPHALAGGGFLQAGAGNPPADDSYPDPGSGLGAATALLLGLLARERTGRGQSMETTMLCTTGYVHSGDLVLYPDRPPRRLPDKGQHGPEALYRLFPCQEGWIFLAARREAEWQRLARTLDRSGWLDDPRFATRADRLRHDDKLVEQLGALFRTRPADDWVRDLRAADLPVARADSDGIDDFLLQNDLLTPAEHPDFGKYWRPHLTVDFPSMPGRLAPPTGIGEYTRPLLAELGYNSAEIESLFAERIVR